MLGHGVVLTFILKLRSSLLSCLFCYLNIMINIHEIEIFWCEHCNFINIHWFIAVSVGFVLSLGNTNLYWCASGHKIREYL